MIYARFASVVVAVLLLASCGGASPAAVPATPIGPTPTVSSLMSGAASAVATPQAAQPSEASIVVQIDAAQAVHPISPWIYGLSGAPEDVQRELTPTLNRWGGNQSTRYNWRLGNAWNAGSDWFYRNGDYGYRGKSASDDFVSTTLALKADVLLTLPTLGWVAKNNDNATCSFPSSSGECGDAAKATCDKPGDIADPKRANVPSDVASISEWVRHLTSQPGFNIRFFAMDNEPDLWGYTHYDVHPTCTTYDEIRDHYLKYASAVRAIAPEAQLLGPVTCCWYYYWNSAAGSADRAQHGNVDFLPWFLQQVREHDQQLGKRTLDVLDIHYYPEGLYNEDADPATMEHRLRSTRSLWDRTYVDESWINEPVYLIPRMRQLLDEHYPGTQLGISEWNWGADRTVGGALALADVLGIFGREGVYLASYWRYPELNSPGFFAFKLFTNYDGQGGRFADTSILASSQGSEKLGVYAAKGSADGKLTVLLINKDADQELTVQLDARQGLPAGQATLYRYSQAAPDQITHEPLQLGGQSTLRLPAYSLSLLVFEATK